MNHPGAARRTSPVAVLLVPLRLMTSTETFPSLSKSRSLYVDLRRADEVNRGGFAVDVDLHAIEFRWRTAFDEIATKPDARRLREVLALDGGPGGTYHVRFERSAILNAVARLNGRSWAGRCRRERG